MTHSRPNRFALVLLLLIGACGRASKDQEAADGRAAKPPAAAETPSTPAPAADVISASGFKDVRFGMSYDELAAHMIDASDTTSIQDGCGFVRIQGAPEDVRFMVEQRRLVRIQTTSPSYASPEGVKVGDDLARITAVYPDARRMPHKYSAGFYYVVFPLAPADTMRRYVFETDRHKVISWRAGLYPPVEYVEGCG